MKSLIIGGTRGFGKELSDQLSDRGYDLLLWQLNTSTRHSLERGNPGLDARFHGHDNKDFRKMDWGY